MQQLYPRHMKALRAAAKIARPHMPLNDDLRDLAEAMSIVREIARLQHVQRNGLPHSTEYHLRKALRVLNAN